MPGCCSRSSSYLDDESQSSPVTARPPTSASPESRAPATSTSACTGPASQLIASARLAARVAALGSAPVIALPPRFGLSSAREGEPGRMVRSVDVRMALHARAPDHEAVARQPRLARVPRGDVTLLAEARFRELEHRLARRAVRLVAVEAVLVHGRVLPEEGAPLLGVAAVTVVVHGVLTQQRVAHRAVWVVAGRAAHEPLAHGHVGVPEHLPAFDQMARRAELGLGLARELVAVGDVLHDDVAGRARHVAGFVGAPRPVQALRLGVAAEAGVVLEGDGFRVLGAEREQRAHALAAFRLDVRETGAVARLAGVRVLGGTRDLLVQDLGVDRL